MPQSLVKNYVHITFSTKNRYPFIDENIEKELYSYIGAICREYECYPVKIGGYKDHIHILCLLSRKMALMNLIEKIKSHSSKWIKTKGKCFELFFWQRGYGCFSVCQNAVKRVEMYIENQKQHHNKDTFKKEYLKLLQKNDIDFEEKYVWD
ncbi:IS200/IS605 family transposase [Saccharicrinis sp. FJH62]|uniref:IS200/IS605 family transposase n=1 Tax=Saccharicrinis sp. FJH62 TaxID=3344657 RepID=UPI0035D4410C